LGKLKALNDNAVKSVSLKIEKVMEIGIYTFADMQPDKVAGGARNGHRRIQELLEEIQLADEVGLDVFAVGEHHRPDYAISAPAVVLGLPLPLQKK
jgi:hypothetical protein